MDAPVSRSKANLEVHLGDISCSPYKALIPEWLQTVLGAAGAISKIPNNAFEAFVDLAKDQLTDGLVPEVQGAHREWMQNTYLDDGQLIRHGTP